MLTEIVSYQRGSRAACLSLSARPAQLLERTGSPRGRPPLHCYFFAWRRILLYRNSFPPKCHCSRITWNLMASHKSYRVQWEWHIPRSLSMWWLPQWQQNFSWWVSCDIFPWKIHWPITLSGYKDGFKYGHQKVNFFTEFGTLQISSSTGLKL